MALTPSVCSPLFYFQLQQKSGGYTYYKLRDLGQLLNFNVKWDGGVVIETDKPYTGE